MNLKRILCQITFTVLMFQFVFCQVLFGQKQSDQTCEEGLSNGSKFSMYMPVKLTGFTHDVIANGIGNAINSTTASVDYAAGMGFAFVAEDFRTTPNSTTPTCFLPNNRQLISGNKWFTLANYSESNSLRLNGPNQSGFLEFETPIAAELVCVLGVSGSGESYLDVEVWFSDGSIEVFTDLYFPDWYAYGNVVVNSVGRVNRNDNVLECDFGPHLFEDVISLSSESSTKLISKIMFSTHDSNYGIMNVLAVSVIPTAIQDCYDSPENMVISANLAQVCMQESFSLILESGLVPHIGMNYQWQRTFSGTNDWADISGANEPIIYVNEGITTDMDYRCVATCNISSLSSFSNIITVSIKPLTECYCIPELYGGNFILNFSLSNVSNSSNPNDNVAGYSDYTSTVEPIQLYYGSMYVPFLTVADADNFEGTAIWIDYNDNGMFEPSEKVTASVYGDNIYYFPAFYVQNNPGIHRLRVQYVPYYSGVSLDPCNISPMYAEVEDYLVEVIALDCIAPSDFKVDSVNYGSAFLSWQNLSAESIEIYVAEEISNPTINTVPNYVVSGASNSITITDLMVEKYYYAWIRTKCNATETSAWSGPIVMYSYYCSVYDATPDCGITKFTTIGGYSNISNQSDISAYTNFSYLACTQFKGGEINFNILSNKNYFATRIWIDWDGNLEFGNDEMVYDSNGITDDNYGSFIIPNYVAIGQYRMRVVINENTNEPLPCDNLGAYYSGEAEDYTLIVLDELDCLFPTNFSINNILDKSATLTWGESFSSDIQGYEVYLSTIPNSPNFGTLPTYSLPASQTSLELDDLSSSTKYYVWIRTHCVGTDYSVWYGPIVFQTYLCNPTSMCEFTFELFDSWGDGWTDNNIDIIQNGVTMYSYTLDDGYETTYTSMLCEDTYTEIKLYIGSFFTEISFSIITSWGETIFESPYFDYYDTDDGMTVFSWVSSCVESNCAMPTNLSLIDLTSNSVEIAWQDEGEANEWELVYGELGTDVLHDGTFIQDITQTSVEINNLPPSSSYQLYLRSICDTDNKSYWVGPFKFFTLQIPATLPFYDDFEAAISEWDFVNDQQNIWLLGTDVASSGTQSAFISVNGSNECEYLNDFPAISHLYRDIEIPETDDRIKLNFNWKGYGNLYDRMQVYILPTSVQPVAGEMLNQGQIGLNKYHFNHNWKNFDIELDPAIYSGQVIRLVFTWTNDESYWDAYNDGFAIDDVSMYLINCLKPVNLDYSIVGENTTELTWEEIGSAVEWDLVVGNIGFDPNTEGTLIEAIEQSQYLLNYLDVQQVYVRAKCGNNEYSSWSAPIIVGDYCTPTTLSQDCHINSFLTQGGIQNIDNNSGGSVVGYGYFLEHVLEQNAGDNVQFSAFLSSEAGFRIMIDFNQNGVFSQNEVVYQSSAYETFHSASFVIPESAIQGNTRMRIICNPFNETGYVNPCYSDFYLGEFEDYTVIINNDNTCEAPSDVSAFAITTSSAWLMWSASESEPIGYQIYYSTSSGAPSSLTSPNFSFGAETFFQLTGLIANTEYFVWVRAKCSNNFYSEWSNIMSFTTDVIPNSENNILEYSFGEFDHQAAEIDEANKSVNIIVAEGTDLSNLVAYFSLSDGALASVDGVVQESGITPNDFYSGSLTYLITAENGETAEWTVNVELFVGIELSNTFNVKLFPNPNDGNFVLSINNINEICSYELFDLTGRCLISKQIEVQTNFNEYFSLDLNAGTYFLRVMSKTDIVSLRFVVK